MYLKNIFTGAILKRLSLFKHIFCLMFGYVCLEKEELYICKLVDFADFTYYYFYLKKNCTLGYLSVSINH